MLILFYIKDEYFVTKALYKMPFYIPHVKKKFVVSKKKLFKEKRLQFTCICVHIFNILIFFNYKDVFRNFRKRIILMAFPHLNFV